MSKVTVVLAIFVFYCVIFALFGLIGYGDAKTKICDVQNGELHDCVGSDTSFFGKVSFFLGGFSFTVSSLPWWADAIIFVPLGIVLLAVFIP